MSGVYLYCIAPAGVLPPEGLLGIDDAPVVAREVAGLSCWISGMARGPEPRVERIRRHNAVVQAAMGADLTPLPVRYGQWLPSAEALEERVVSQRERHEAALRRVAGAVEFGVRVLDPALGEGDAAPAAEGGADAPPAASGSEYLRALAAREAERRGARDRGQEIAASLRALLGPIVREERVEALPSRRGLVSVAHLVHRSQVGAYRERVDEARREWSSLRFLVSGPWPPYSFVA